MATGKPNNYDKLVEAVNSHKPFIVYDVEATGIMNGNDNRITQIALAAYDYNPDSRAYEMQDNIFMLAKPQNEVMYGIMEAEVPSVENATRILEGNYDYEYSKASDVKKAKMPTKEEYVASKLDEKIAEMRDAVKLEETLKLQGIDMDEWMKSGTGLTAEEMQKGVSEFLKKYDSPDTKFLTNGTYYSNHYLQKEGITLSKAPELIIDMTQAMRTKAYSQAKAQHLGTKWQDMGGDWTASVKDFAERYQSQSGKTIENFDALTKAMCFAQIAGSVIGMDVEHRSANLTANKVMEMAAGKDEDYVMSMARASSLNWEIVTEQEFATADFHFSSLEYIDFGNDRKYVDIDKMFEMNDNFEITLEGDKTPIKSWDELENKIKALNADISPELMDKIHEKFDEVSKQRDEKVQEVLQANPEQKAPESEQLKAMYSLVGKLEAQVEKLSSQLEATQAEVKDLRSQLGVEPGYVPYPQALGVIMNIENKQGYDTKIPYAKNVIEDIRNAGKCTQDQYNFLAFAQTQCVNLPSINKNVEKNFDPNR